MRPKSLARELSGTVKEMLGTAQSLGSTVDGRRTLLSTSLTSNSSFNRVLILIRVLFTAAHDIIEAIDSGEIEIPSE